MPTPDTLSAPTPHPLLPESSKTREMLSPAAPAFSWNQLGFTRLCGASGLHPVTPGSPDVRHAAHRHRRRLPWGGGRFQNSRRTGQQGPDLAAPGRVRALRITSVPKTPTPVTARFLLTE